MLEPVSPRETLLATCPYLAATVSPGLHQGCGGAQLDGLRLMEDDCWERFLFQCEDIQFRLQHGLKVLKDRKRSHIQVSSLDLHVEQLYVGRT